MPDTLTPQDLAAIRERDVNVRMAARLSPAGRQRAADRRALLAHIDALTAAVEGMKVGGTTDYERGWDRAVGAVLAILREPHDA